MPLMLGTLFGNGVAQPGRNRNPLGYRWNGYAGHGLVWNQAGPLGMIHELLPN